MKKFIEDIKIAIINMGYVFNIAGKHDKTYICFLFVSTLIQTALPFIIIVFPKYIIDKLVSDKDLNGAIVYTLLMAGSAFIFRLFSVWLDNIKLNKLMILKIWFYKMLGKKSMVTDFQNIENPEVLNLFERARSAIDGNTGVNTAGHSFKGEKGIDAFSSEFVNIASSIAKIAGLIYIIATLNPLILGLILLIVFINAILNSRMQNAEFEYRKKAAPVFRKWTYAFNAMTEFEKGKEIRVFNLTDFLKSKFVFSCNLMYTFAKTSFNTFFVAKSITAFMNFSRDAFMYIYLIYKVIAGTITIGAFTMYLAAISSFSSALTELLYAFINLMKYSTYMSDFRKVMTLDNEKRLRTTRKIDNKFSAHEIEFQNVWFKYPSQSDYTLKDISIKIKRGEKLSIVGENGAGKTTFIKLLIGLYTPQKGRIMLDGIDISEFDYDDYLDIITAVFQDFKLFAFTIKENIALEKADNTDESRIYTALKKAGLFYKVKSLPQQEDTQLFKQFEENGTDISGGEQQKLAISRAFFKDSSIVVLDEPTAALDPMAENEMYLNFNDLVQNKTAIFISHRMSSSRFCDRVAVFENGMITQQGTHKELMEHCGKYKDMFTAQAQYYTDAKGSERVLEEYLGI